MPENIFVFVVCGSEEHIKTLHYSLQHLQQHTNNRIIVVTDLNRNQIPVNHHTVIHIPTQLHQSSGKHLPQNRFASVLRYGT